MSSAVGPPRLSTNTQLGRVACVAPEGEGGVEGTLGGELPIELQGKHPTQPLAVAGLEHDIAASPHVEAMQGRLQGEATPIDRGRERQHGRLRIPAHLTDAFQLRTELELTVHRATLRASRQPHKPDRTTRERVRSDPHQR